MNPKLRSTAAATIAVLVGVVGLMGCSRDNNIRTESPVAVVEADDDGFHGTVIVPPLRPANVALTHTSGARFNLARPAPDKVTALFFGFTNCDDVCPTTMADLAAARRSLPAPIADKVTVIFVTVDPRRDTPAVLEEWLDRFDQDFIALRGPTDLVHEAERSLYSAESAINSSAAGHRTQSGDNRADYEVSHSGFVYVFAPGDKSLLYTGGTTAQEYVEDFTRLLNT